MAALVQALVLSDTCRLRRDCQPVRLSAPGRQCDSPYRNGDAVRKRIYEQVTRMPGALIREASVRLL